MSAIVWPFFEEVRNMNEVASFSLSDFFDFKPILIILIIVIVCVGLFLWWMKKRNQR